MFAGNDVGVRFLTSGDCDTVWASQPSLQTPSCRVDWGATRQGFLAKLVAVLGLGPAKDKLPATSIIGIWRIFISFVIILDLVIGGGEGGGLVMVTLESDNSAQPKLPRNNGIVIEDP